MTKHRQHFGRRAALLGIVAALCLPGCHDDHPTSRFRTLPVDDHGHVHDPNDGHDHAHGAEKRIASH